jgi:hypothetical protein
VFDFSSLADEQYHTSAGGQSVSVQFCPKGVLPAGRVLEEAGDGVTLSYTTSKACGSGKETNVINLVCPTNGAGDEGGVRLTFEQTADCTNFFRAETTLACPAVGGFSTTTLVSMPSFHPHALVHPTPRSLLHSDPTLCSA